MIDPAAPPPEAALEAGGVPPSPAAPPARPTEEHMTPLTDTELHAYRANIGAISLALVDLRSYAWGALSIVSTEDALARAREVAKDAQAIEAMLARYLAKEAA